MKALRIKIPLREYVSLLHRYLRPQRKAIAGLAVLLAAGIAMQLVNPQIIRFFIDTAGEEGMMKVLIYAAGLYIGISLLHQGVSVAAAYLGEHVGWTATNRLRGDVAAHCLRLDLSFHKNRTSGEIVERVDGDINALANFFSNFVILLLSNLVLMAGILMLLFREDWRIGLAMLVFVVFAVSAIQHIRKYAIPHWGRLRQMSAEFFGFLGEHLEGTEDTRANGATGFVMRRFHLLLRRWLPVRIRAFMGWAAMWITTIVVFTIGTAVAFAVIAYLWPQGAITIGTAFMIVHYTDLLAKPIERIRTQMEDLQKADASITRIRELMELESAIRDGEGASLSGGPLSVQFDRVSFGYEEGMATLDGIDFRLAPGRVMGVLGRTGSGKTTLARLLLRFYDPGSGAVRVGGVDIRDVKVRELRSKVGMVTQSIEIFQGTVRDNLTFFDDGLEDEHIAAVLEELGLGDWLKALPDGLDTMLESGGGGLSAGEAQLLAFARVFLRDPGLVILDEASSRLDPATEQLLERAMNRLLQNRTCIIIAHRLATVQRADDILMLEDGRVIEYGSRVIEYGSREALAADASSRFSRLLAVGLEEVLS